MSRKWVNASLRVHGTGRRFIVSHLLIGPKGPKTGGCKISSQHSIIMPLKGGK